MKKLLWFERQFTFGNPTGMLPFYIERLEGTIARIERKVKGVSEEILSTRLNNKWSIKENIGHLAEVDEVALRRIDEIISGTSILSPAVFEPKAYFEWPIHEVVNYFKEARNKNLQRYGSLTSDELERSSLHPRLNLLMTPVDLAWFDAEHDDHHLVSMNEILQFLQHRSYA
jgi:hypothetical protein